MRDERTPPGRRANLVLNGLAVLSWLWMLWGGRRQGDRLWWNLNSLWALLAMAGIGLLGRSPLLVSNAGVIAGCFVFKLVAGTPARDRHSFSIGESWFGGGHVGWLVWAGAGVILGAVLSRHDPTAGWYYALAGASLGVQVGLARARQKAVDRDLLDAQIEARARAERIGGR